MLFHPPKNPFTAATPSGAVQGHRRRWLTEGAPGQPPLAVSDVLTGEAASFFVCKSDALYFNEPPPIGAGLRRAAPAGTNILPASGGGGRAATLERRHGALAVRASAAIAAKRPERRGDKKNLRVVPVPVREEVEDCEDVLFNEILNERTLGEFTMSVSPAKKSNQKLAARSRLRLKHALSIIQESTD